MQPPEMPLDVLPTDFPDRLPDIREQPLDQPPIPSRRPLRPPAHADQERRPSIQKRGTISLFFPFAGNLQLLLILAFTPCFEGSVDLGSCAHGINLLANDERCQDDETDSAG